LIFAVSFYVRMKVEESPSFQRAVARAAPERVPLLAVLKRCKAATLQVLFCAMAESSTFYFTSVFGLSYGIQTLGLGNGLLLSGVALGNAVGILTNPAFGALSDRIGRKPLLGASYLLAAAYVLTLFFPMLRAKEPWLVGPKIAIPGAILRPMSLAVSGSFYRERFRRPAPAVVEVSLGRQLGDHPSSEQRRRMRVA
jgi:MFS family permease